jgi:hypothetical protein
MKILISTVLLFATFFTAAQEFTLENKWVKGSDQIYFGINNYLIIKGAADSIRKIESNAGIQRQHDSLLVMPSQEKVIIILYTRNGKTSFVYKAINLPLMKISFGCRDFNKTAQSVIIQTDTSNYFHPYYTIVQYVIKIDGRELMGQSNYMTSAVLDALDKAPDGSKVFFKEIVFWNKETDHYLWTTAGQSWTIDRKIIKVNEGSSTCQAEYLQPGL